MKAHYPRKVQIIFIAPYKQHDFPRRQNRSGTLRLLQIDKKEKFAGVF